MSDITILELIYYYYNDTSEFKCFCGCGAILDYSITEKGHVISRYKEGKTVITNLRPICKTCNLQMGTMHMFEWMKMYDREPPIFDKEFENYEYENKINYINFQPRKIRYEITNNVFNEENKEIVGVINAPTGSGKTAMCIEGLGKFIKGKIILWLTEFTRILETQFTPYNIACWKNAGFIPKETAFLDKLALKRCWKFPDTCIIYSTIDTARLYYNKIKDDKRFIGFVIDESHHSGAPETFNMLHDLKNRSGGIDICIGLSATHTDSNKTRQLFGDMPYLYDYTLLEGWRDCIIREIKILCCFLNKNVSANNNLFDKIKNKEVLINNLENILSRTQTKKGIIWCEFIEEANKWYNFIKSEFDKRKINVNIYIDHTGINSSNNLSQKFIKKKNNAIMITAQKYGEGVDIPNLDFGGIISECTGSANERVIIQRIGRLLRKEGRPGPALFCNFSVSTNEEVYAKEMKDIFVNYFNTSRKKREAIKRKFKNEKEQKINIKFHDTAIKCEVDEINIIFEFIDGIKPVELFKHDAEFVADMLYNTGKGISFGRIKQILKENNIKSPPDAQIFLYSCNENFYPEIYKWWEIAKYLPLNYTTLLDLDDSNCYKTLAEAKNALFKAEKELINEESLKTIIWDDLYKKCREIDPKLPLDWKRVYNLKEVHSYWKFNIKKLMKAKQ